MSLLNIVTPTVESLGLTISFFVQVEGQGWVALWEGGREERREGEGGRRKGGRERHHVPAQHRHAHSGVFGTDHLLLCTCRGPGLGGTLGGREGGRMERGNVVMSLLNIVTPTVESLRLTISFFVQVEGQGLVALWEGGRWR